MLHYRNSTFVAPTRSCRYPHQRVPHSEHHLSKQTQSQDMLETVEIVSCLYSSSKPAYRTYVLCTKGTPIGTLLAAQTNRVVAA